MQSSMLALSLLKRCVSISWCNSPKWYSQKQNIENIVCNDGDSIHPLSFQSKMNADEMFACRYLHKYIYIYTSKHSQTLHDFLCIPSGNAPSSRPGRSGNSSSTVASSNISKGGGSGATSGGFMMVALGLLLILLMVQKSGKLTSWGSLSHYLQGFDDHPRSLLGISSINSRFWWIFVPSNKHQKTY